VKNVRIFPDRRYSESMKKTVFRPIEPSDLAAAVHHLITLAVEYEAAHTKRHRHPETHAAASNYRRVWRGTKSEKMLVTVVQLARADQERRNQQRRAVLAAAQIPVVAARLKWLHGRRGGGHGSSTVEALHATGYEICSQKRRSWNFHRRCSRTF
jgi:hypothetical protein